MILYHLGTVLCYIGYAWVASRFCKRQLKQFCMPEWLWILLFTIGILGILHLSEEGLAPYIVTALLHHGFIGILIFLGGFGGTGKKLLVTGVLLLTKELAGNFFNSLFSCLALLVLGGKQNEAISLGWKLDLGIGCMSFILFFILLWFMGNWLSPVFSGKPDRWYRMLSLPLFFLLFLIDIVNWGASNGVMVVYYKYIYQSFGVYQNQIFSHSAICLLTALCFVLAGCVIVGMEKIYTGERKQEQYKLQTSFYEMLTEQHNRQEQLWHDMKNHVLCLQELWKGEDWQRLGRYLEQMQGASDLKWEECSGSNVLDALLYNKQKQAEKRNISWMCEVSSTFGNNMEEFDLCILIGNLLDNAMEAAGKVSDGEAYVCIQTQKRNKYMLLLVKNTTELERLELMEEGIGLANVRRVIKQYGGVIQMQLEDCVFSVSVLLPGCLPNMSEK